ncbi:hypothetical protein BJ684DRAFT_21496 [Piptocephalis cylindrospora]|uniref:Uncharacterized protein n=1 Tax=Piptocephalis cylindrospora TaxID=1907219 RepID=A0A4P9XZS2_9FUNG|nr:hypothetical protein BJ684DRAFT_21496 [Piptocephalis cylindrospora]|eukprot:RKP11927.1 hypothetical protein BJ684DRAFT_21496 [Piptocephalis cylindrospora]
MLSSPFILCQYNTASPRRSFGRVESWDKGVLGRPKASIWKGPGRRTLKHQVSEERSEPESLGYKPPQPVPATMSLSASSTLPTITLFALLLTAWSVAASPTIGMNGEEGRVPSFFV